MKGAKFASSDKVYTKCCLQFSKEFMDSVLVRHHCFGARIGEAITNLGGCLRRFTQLGFVECAATTPVVNRTTTQRQTGTAKQQL